MSDEKEPMDREAAIEGLNRALRLQYRSALGYAIGAGSVTGFAFQGLGALLWGFAQAELEDARRLVEKIVALGGEPAVDAAPVEAQPDVPALVDWLVACERETLEALQDVIPHTGQTGESEALEHRLEHLIMRKQEQVDALERARRG
jgi:bacterioferritin